MKLNSSLKRFGAFCIDYVILLSIAVAISFLSTKLFGPSSNTVMGFMKTLTSKILGEGASSLFDPYHLQISMSICFFVYFVYFERSKWQATIGKKFLKLKVTDSKGKRLSLHAAIKRLLIFAAPAFVFYFLVLHIAPQCLAEVPCPISKSPCGTLCLSYIVCYLIWVAPIFLTKNKTTLYDMLSKTKVRG